MGMTFDYRQHNVAGGKTQSVVTQGPKPEARQGLITPPPPPEGHYVTREKSGRMSPVDYRQNLRWLQQQQAKGLIGHPESTEEWLKRHRIGQYASA